MSTNANKICQDCDTRPNASEGQAQPARKADMSTIPSPSSLPGPSPRGETQSKALEPESTQSPTEIESIKPPEPVTPSMMIEFCDRCRWAPRATWIQTELFLTFPTPAIKAITLIPLNAPETGGRFRVWLDRGQGQELVWDRKTEGGFPELKILKQRLRNLIQPEMSLGHSDKPASEAK